MEFNLLIKTTTANHLHHLEWFNICMVIYFTHMKNDQIGEKKRPKS